MFRKSIKALDKVMVHFLTKMTQILFSKLRINLSCHMVKCHLLYGIGEFTGTGKLVGGIGIL